nr:glucan biosynthesis protein G [Deltaproteobacteria bacterium]
MKNRQGVLTPVVRFCASFLHSQGNCGRTSMRTVFVCLLGWLMVTALAVDYVNAASTFAFQSVIKKAQELAKAPYQENPRNIPDFLSHMGYDAWRDIRFKPEHALWKNEKTPFRVQFFHPGMMYNKPVRINVVDSIGIREIPFSPNLFTYGQNTFQDRIPGDLGFAGFRLHYPLNTKDYYDEVAVFLGATYLRAVAQGQQYGMSARGLAVNTALSEGEEYPSFVEFWIVRPSATSGEIIVYALLDSKSLTGAYKYVVRPGKETVILISSVLFMREDIAKLGLAPLTSMFYYGETSNERPAHDFRPEVHDSDGLLIAFDSGEWLWRPLINPRTLQVHAFEAPSPAGFGLLQRDKDFNNYQDLESRYDLRPSVWISPNERWGQGHIELIQIPTGSDANDNILAFWTLGRSPRAGEKVSFSYTMTWYSPDGDRPPGGRVLATRMVRGRDERSRKFIIDFIDGQLETFPADKALTAVITVDDRTQLLEQQLYKNRVTKGWRLVFKVSMEEDGAIDKVLLPKRSPLEFRAFLKEGENAVTETWNYACQP